jgi:hypothetical protein
MTQQEQLWFRLELFCTLIGQAPGRLGRTAIMKLAYLLQTVKDLPLGYDFRLHTYGPFDSDVLNDLGSAEALGAVKSQMVTFPSGSGYGYEFTTGANGAFIRQKAGGRLSDHEPAIRWALDEFGSRSAAELELLTTIIYADREAAQRREQLSVKELARKVGEVKPHFPEQYVVEKVEELSRKRLLIALPPTQQAQ